MKKSFLSVAIVLFVAAAVALAYGFERQGKYNDSFMLSETQEQDSQLAAQIDDSERATELLNYAADNLKNANDAQTMAMVGFGAALILVIARIVVWRKGKIA